MSTELAPDRRRSTRVRLKVAIEAQGVTEPLKCEGETEIVAGYCVEYSSMTFALFYLGEYGNMILMSAMTSVLFLGGWLAPFGVAPFTWVPGIVWFTLKALFVFFMFALVKALVPRYRYDQLMRLGWKVFLPLSLAMVAIVAGVLQLAGWAPVPQ